MYSGKHSKDTTNRSLVNHARVFAKRKKCRCRETEIDLSLFLPPPCISTESKIQSLWGFSCKASFLLVFLLRFFIPGMGNRGQQQSVGMHFFIVRLDHGCVDSGPAGVTGTRWRRRHARLWAAPYFILPFQRRALPVDNLCIFILLIFFFVLTLCKQKLLERVCTCSVSARGHLRYSVFPTYRIYVVAHANRFANSHRPKIFCDEWPKSAAVSWWDQMRNLARLD